MRKKNLINILPMIDLVLILLVFTLYALTKSQHINNFNIDLPELLTKNMGKEKTSQMVSINEKGEYFLDNKKIDIESLNLLNPNLALTINGHKSSPWEAVLKLLKELQKLKFKKIEFLHK